MVSQFEYGDYSQAAGLILIDLARKPTKVKRNFLDEDSIVFEPFTGSEYIIDGSRQNSSRGFGVLAGKLSKRYIVRRKIGEK
ncbi:MAG: hypothetical protein Q7R66_18315 [Undibacterium sp.]|uniref:hypothetical protein n=1 Tax=Undibacterium sp. TaxID=1914977 RepID=UPI0027209719|nr:hypothetical protein [Undibacterium sp.]MDO8654130.1 hypothetical protein [Undibacterium sp.]